MNKKQRTNFDHKVESFLERIEQCRDGYADELALDIVEELAKFYRDRRIYTRWFCSCCGAGSSATDGMKDYCPACHATGFITLHTEVDWKKKCKEWGLEYVAI